MFVLHLLQGPRQGEEFDVDRELTLGRENVDVVIEDEELSRRHAVVRISDGDLQIEDMGSLNGTLVNNLPISAVTRLVAGDLIEVGSTVLEVRVRDDDPGKTVLKTRLPEPDVAPDTGPMQPEPPPDSDPTMVVVRDPTEIEHEVSPAPVAGGQPPPLPPIPSAPPAPAAVPVRFLFSGQRYLLGETSGMYGIWDRSAPGTPVESFPRDDEGWHRAWETFSAREPDAQRVADEEGSGGAPQGTPTSLLQPRSRSGLVTAAGVLLFVEGALSLLSALYYLSTDDPAVDESVAQIIGVINLIIGAAAVVAGILVLQRKPAGRIMAFVVNGILLLSAILAIVQGEPLGLVNAIFASLIIAFLKDGSDFRPAR